MNIAIVTGASSGMGREFVRQLGGYVSVDEIWAVARRASALETLKAEKSPTSGCWSTPRASANSALTGRFP